MSIESDIQSFITYFIDQAENIKCVVSQRPGSSGKIYQKILYATLLDSLTIAAAPSLARKNKERFLNLVRGCSDWREAERVSSVQLKLRLEKKNIRGGTLYSHVANVAGEFSSGAVLIAGHHDPLESEVKALVSPNDQTAMKLIEKCRYDSLLYIYRNNLVHEFREPGYGGEFGDDEFPFYHSMLNDSPQLSFPLEFFRRLCFSCIWGVHDILVRERRDPRKAYGFGSIW
jgi:hypothetical protein